MITEHASTLKAIVARTIHDMDADDRLFAGAVAFCGFIALWHWLVTHHG